MHTWTRSGALIADTACQLGTSTYVLQLRSCQPLLRVRCVVASAHHLKYRDMGREGAFAIKPIQFASREVPAAASHSAQQAQKQFVPQVHQEGRWAGFQRPVSLCRREGDSALQATWVCKLKHLWNMIGSSADGEQ